MKSALLGFLAVLCLAAPSLAQNPYNGNALPTAPWSAERPGSPAGTIVSLGGGNNGLQLIDNGGSTAYNQYYAGHGFNALTLSGRFQLVSTDGQPHLAQLSLPGSANPSGAEPSLALAILGGNFVLKSLNNAVTYTVLGTADSDFHDFQLYVSGPDQAVKASWDGSLVLNTTATGLGLDTNFNAPNEGYVEWGSGTYNHATGLTTTIWDSIQYNSGDTVVPEPTSIALIGIAAAAGVPLVLRRRRKA